MFRTNTAALLLALLVVGTAGSEEPEEGSPEEEQAALLAAAHAAAAAAESRLPPIPPEQLRILPAEETTGRHAEGPPMFPEHVETDSYPYDSDEEAVDSCDRVPCWFLEFLGGAYFTTSVGPGVPDFHYAPIDFRLGWRPFYRGDRSWRDGGSVLLDLTSAPIFKGPGSILGGPSLLLRWDLFHPSHILVPYLQGGAGLWFTDASEDLSQRAIGSSTEFLLEAEIGARVRCTDYLSVVVEGGYQHISNADTADRNSGVNTFGGSLGVMIAPGR